MCTVHQIAKLLICLCQFATLYWIICRLSLSIFQNVPIFGTGVVFDCKKVIQKLFSAGQDVAAAVAPKHIKGM